MSEDSSPFSKQEIAEQIQEIYKYISKVSKGLTKDRQILTQLFTTVSNVMQVLKAALKLQPL